MSITKEDNRRNSLIIPIADEPKTEEQPTSTTESMQIITKDTLAAMQESIRG